jgi:phosphopantetheinyl transferase
MNDSIDEDARCPCVIVKATSAALWKGARKACDDALAQGHAFVAILHGAESFADERLLTDQDRQRAMRFRQPSDRHNFALGRTMVHQLVGARDDSTPRAFSVGSHGKPFLPGAPAYNLSHSGRWVACAVAQYEPIGIDVETFARLQNYHDLIPAIAHQAERHCIEQAPSDNRLALFKRCWTRKEAVLKATGTGLSDDLQDIDICLAQGEPVLEHPTPLRLIDFPVDEGQVMVALALSPSVPGVVAMFVEAALGA